MRAYADSFYVTTSSGNSKIGKMLVTTSNAGTCPDACPLKGSGCYAEHGPMGMMWRSLSQTDPGQSWRHGSVRLTALSWGQLIDRIKSYDGDIWRHNQAGDLPGDGEKIDVKRLAELVEANGSRLGYTYTHYPPTKHNLRAIKSALTRGFVINLSADTLAEADALAAHGPTVVVLPSGQQENLTTPGGRSVVICPAYTHGVQCSTCKLCARDRDVIVGFPAHGTGKRRVESVYNSNA